MAADPALHLGEAQNSTEDGLGKVSPFVSENLTRYFYGKALCRDSPVPHRTVFETSNRQEGRLIRVFGREFLVDIHAVTGRLPTE